MTIAMSITDGSLELLIGLAVLLAGVIIGGYTRLGSGIDHHPYARRYGDSPGARRRPQISGREGIARLSSRGTR